MWSWLPSTEEALVPRAVSEGSAAVERLGESVVDMLTGVLREETLLC